MPPLLKSHLGRLSRHCNIPITSSLRVQPSLALAPLPLFDSIPQPPTTPSLDPERGFRLMCIPSTPQPCMRPPATLYRRLPCPAPRSLALPSKVTTGAVAHVPHGTTCPAGSVDTLNSPCCQRIDRPNAACRWHPTHLIASFFVCCSCLTSAPGSVLVPVVKLLLLEPLAHSHPSPLLEQPVLAYTHHSSPASALLCAP